MENKPNYKLGITHAGNFHADDVFSTALLKILFPNIKILRKNNIEKILLESPNTIVYDTGGGKYDHHNKKDKEKRKCGIPYAAFGKLWRDFGKYLLNDEEDIVYIDNILVKHIDNTDNGGPANPMTSAIKAFNPNWNDINSTESQFDMAVNFAKTILNNYISKKKSEKQADETIRNIRKIQRGGVIILDKYIPIPYDIDSNLYFSIYPSKREGYTLDTVLLDKKNKCPRIALSKEWFKKEPKGLKYLHQNLHFAIFDSQQHALDAVESILKYIYNPDLSMRIIKKRIKDSNNIVYSNNKLDEPVKIYGILKLNDYNILCPILSNSETYSLIPIEYNTIENKFFFQDTYYGMIKAGDEEKDPRINFVYRPSFTYNN